VNTETHLDTSYLYHVLVNVCNLQIEAIDFANAFSGWLILMDTIQIHLLTFAECK
jgi:hypothetical protein